MLKVSAISFFIIGLNFSLSAQDKASDSLAKQSVKKYPDRQAQYALPYLHCPLEIRFNPYDSVAGYMDIRHLNNKPYKTSKITYPQYHFQTWEACDWPRETFMVYLYSNHGVLLNKFKVMNPPQNGQVGNIGEIQDMRKKRKKLLSK